MSEQGKISKGFSRIVGAVSTICVLAFALFVTAVAVLATGPIEAPEWLRARVEGKLEALLGTNSLDIESLEISFDLNFLAPAAHIQGIEVRGAEGELVAALSSATADFDIGQLLKGKFVPKSLRVPHLRLGLVQEIDGTLAFAVHPIEIADESGLAAPQDLSDFMDLLRDGELAFLDYIEVEEVEFEIRSLSREHSWHVERGSLKIESNGSSVAGKMTFRISHGDRLAAYATVEFTSPDSESETFVEGRLSGVRAQELLLGDAFDELASRLDAAIVVEAEAKLQSDGKLADISARLRVFKGSYSYSVDKAISVNGAEFDFDIEPLASRVNFSRIAFDSDVLKFAGKGYAMLPRSSETERPNVVGSLEFFDSEFFWPEQFDSPISDISGQMTFRMGNRPQAMEFFGTAIDSNSNRFFGDGKLVLTEDGLSASLSASAKRLSMERIIALWPKKIAPAAREWAKDRINGGVASNLHGAVLLEPSRDAKAGLTWRFSLDEAHYAESWPPISEASGYGELTAHGLTVVFEKGRIQIPDSGSVNVAESTLSVRDFRDKNRRASAIVQFGGELKSIFGLLDEEPINFLRNAGISPDFASGLAQGEANLDFPMRKHLSTSDFRMEAAGTARLVSVADVARGRSFFSNELAFKIRNKEITVSGEGNLGRIPVSGTWSKNLDEGIDSGSIIAGNFPLSANTIKEFGVELPEDAAVGEQTANFTVEFASDANPQAVLATRLDEFALSIPALGWRKPKGQTGDLTIISDLAENGAPDRFEFETEGLWARGHFHYSGAGEIERAEFSRLRVGDWLDAPVSIEMDGDRFAVKVTGGTLDLRQIDIGSELGRSQEATPVFLNLDKLIYSDKVVLTNVRGVLELGEKIDGRLTGLVNGSEEVELALSGSRRGTRVDIVAKNAGAALSAAGVLDNIYGGKFQASILPGEEEGRFVGKFKITNARVVGMPLLGAILDLISVVGLLEKLSGEGIRFQTIEGEFTMADSGIVFREGSAAGPSIGLTFAGGVNTEKSRINMSGVITPIYLLNGILEQMEFVPKIFGKRKGEGVFAFNYGIKGDSRRPKITVNPVSGLLPGFLRDLVSSLTTPASR